MLIGQTKVKLILLFPYLHLAEIHHPQRTQGAINSERCPWVSMNPSAPLRNGPELGLCLDLRASWRYCPHSPCNLSLSTAKFRQPHWLHTHEPCVAKMPQAGNPCLTPWLRKRWYRTRLKFSSPLFAVSWSLLPSPNAHPLPYWLQSRGRNTELWQTTELIDRLLLVTYFSLEMKLICSVGGKVGLLLKFLGEVC